MNLVSLYNRRRYVQSDRLPVRGYYDMEFKFIVENKYYSVLIDLFKQTHINYETGEIINDNPRLHFSEEDLKESFKDLIIDLSKSSTLETAAASSYPKEEIDELFKKFYYFNRKYLNTCQFKDIPIKSLDQNQTIQHQQQQQLKKIRQQQMPLYRLQQLQQEAQVVNIIKVQNLDLLELSIFYSNYQFFRVIWDGYYCNCTLDPLKKSKYVDWCLMNGDVELLDYLFNKLSFKEFDRKNALQYACISENRENTLRYLFNIMDFKTIQIHVELQSCILYKIMQIDHTLYKQLHGCLPIDSFKSPLELLNLSNNLPFKQFLNLNLNLNLNNPSFKSTLTQILNFDSANVNCNGNNSIYFNSLNSSCNNISNNRLIKNFKSLFKVVQQPTLSSSCTTTISFDKLNFNSFNIKREVKRYYIYYNLLNQNSLETNLILLKFIFKFINKYQEYQLIDHLLYPDKYSYLNNTFLSNQYKLSLNNQSSRPKRNSKYNLGDDDPNIYFLKKVVPVYACCHTELFIHLYNNKRNEFNWSHKNISIKTVTSQNLQLIKFLYENDIFIFRGVLDNTEINSLPMVEYLVSKGFPFTKESFFNSLKDNNLELFRFYIDHSNDYHKQFIYSSINSFYSLISDNLFILKQLNDYIQDLTLEESKFCTTVVNSLRSRLIVPKYLKINN
ncbi:hypothetical protein DICPUDRAFT_76834 [Dictyostelium purpureum]|uniref:Uncharacterized protein n=1 Tax=Dictyostelium purpureum TaxID=5786 RepID=F0ZES5_DICPU|nr:uncharacterized protein DICPUDRAFT_76834 [Dictyostelium purpureum]EGC37544.1 hypothetical protein DICPUDRAFT_76834 [Dictyostelium purpureum]|eukprot:XP_003285935.1 hypothetical protein DICPUDRAFT_76834 [Dictyostelium purpureum]